MVKKMRCFKPEKGAVFLRNSSSHGGVENSISHAHSLFWSDRVGKSQPRDPRWMFDLWVLSGLERGGLGKSGLKRAELQLLQGLNPCSLLNERVSLPCQLRWLGPFERHSLLQGPSSSSTSYLGGMEPGIVQCAMSDLHTENLSPGTPRIVKAIHWLLHIHWTSLLF